MATCWPPWITFKQSHVKTERYVHCVRHQEGLRAIRQIDDNLSMQLRRYHGYLARSGGDKMRGQQLGFAYGNNR